ncbi:MAG: hypothetical protein ACLVGR_03915 [Anaerovoracaceae bacterium]
MRKTIFTALLSLTAVAAGAQTMYDGLTFSQNNYYGTARSIGMGNAMTAVGGDLGSIGINPAGSVRILPVHDHAESHAQFDELILQRLPCRRS